MAATDDDLRKIRFNDLEVPECRQALAGFLAAGLREQRRVNVEPGRLELLIGAYVNAVKTGLLEVAQALQRAEQRRDEGV